MKLLKKRVEEKLNNTDITVNNSIIKTGDVSNPYSNMGKRRKRLPFENKTKRVKPETRDRYLLIVKGLRQYNYNDRKSIPGETFSFKKEKLIFINFSGSTLKVYFKLDPKKYIDSTIPIKDVSNLKKYKDVPSCLVIKSDLAARRAVKLGEQIAKDKKIPCR